MAHVDPTPDTFIVDFPEFEDEDPDEIQRNINVAKRLVDSTWTEGDYTRAIELYAAHLFARRDIAAETGGQAGISIASESLGPMSLSYQKQAPQPTADPLFLQTTTYGQEFAMLLRLNRGGARVA